MLGFMCYFDDVGGGKAKEPSPLKFEDKDGLSGIYYGIFDVAPF